MSNTDDPQVELGILDDEPAPKKKTARKRAAKKATRKRASTDSKVEEKESQVGGDSAEVTVERERESAPAPRSRRSPRPNQEADVPEVFSASPDDMDDYGDVSHRQERAKEAKTQSKADTRDVQPANEEARSPREDAAAPEQQASTGNEGQPAQPQGGYSRDHRHDRKNKFERFKGKKDFKPFQNSHQQSNNQGGGQPQGGQHPKQKFKKGKKNKWQSAPGFASAADDDMDPPSFESLVDWDLFKSDSNLKDFVQLNVDESLEPLDYNALCELSLKELEQRAQKEEVTCEGLPGRSKLIRAFLQKARTTKRPIKVRGVVEVLETGYGFLVFERDNLRLRTDSPFIAAGIVDRIGLQRGHEIEALLNAPKESETCPFVIKLTSVMGRDPESIKHLTPFNDLTPYYPTERIVLESAEGALGKWDNISMRVVDLLSPVGLGQRGLIVAPPRTGKTVLMQGIANSIRVNKPDVKLIILLVDERPEEVTDFRRSVKGAEVISSTFDESAESHVHAAEMVIEKARRMVECGQHVIILLDSITRLARAYNTLMPSSGKILSGGVEASALQKPKRFFGSARSIEEGGSLTILGTALIDTGSKMDEVIFEEFKGTGNMELHLDRELSNKRVFPALSFERSGTRKEELLYHPDEMQKVYALRRAMKGVPSVEAMEMLISRVKKTKTNAEFLLGMGR